MGEGDVEMQDVTPSTSGNSLKTEKKRFEVKKVRFLKVKSTVLATILS